MMKTTIIIIVVLFWNVGFSLYQMKQKEFYDIYNAAWQKAALEKYQWKSDRLKVYNDLVFNVNGGAVYDK